MVDHSPTETEWGLSGVGVYFLQQTGGVRETPHIAPGEWGRDARDFYHLLLFKYRFMRYTENTPTSGSNRYKQL